MANQNNRRDFGKLIATLTRVFKSADTEHLRDLEDAVDVPSFSDQWNSGDHGNKPRVTTGPMESASGGGAEKMVSEYADGAMQTGLSAAYEAFAKELCDVGKRLEKSERGLAAVAALIATAMGKSSADVSKMFSADDESEEDEEKDEDATEKAGKVHHVANVGGIEGLMRSLMGTSRASVPSTLANPPSMAVLKAGADAMTAAIEFADASGNHAEVLRLRTLKMRQQSAAAGANVPERFLRGEDFAVPNPQVGTPFTR
jgi:hypothetical protein